MKQSQAAASTSAARKQQLHQQDHSTGRQHQQNSSSSHREHAVSANKPSLERQSHGGSGGVASTFSNSGSHKSQGASLGSSGNLKHIFQPVLRTKAQDDHGSKTTQNPGAQLKKQGSGQMEKKNKSSNRMPMKEETFNYEERSATKKQPSSSTPNSNLFKRRSPHQSNAEESSYGTDYRSSAKQLEKDLIQVQMSRSKEEHEDQADSLHQQPSQDHFEDRIRPSDEVQYHQRRDSQEAQMIGVFGGNKAKVNTLNNIKDPKMASLKGTEESKSEFKNVPVLTDEEDYYQEGGEHKTYDHHFEVVEENEEIKDEYYDNDLQSFKRLADQRQNSDFKRFNIDEDYQLQNSLRLGGASSKERIRHDTYGSKDHDLPYQRESLQDTPKNIKDKTKNQNAFALEQSFKGKNPDGVGGVSSPQSFGSPAKTSSKTPMSQQELAQQLQQKSNLQKQINSNMNPAHILSFADKNQAYQIDDYPPLQKQNQSQFSELEEQKDLIKQGSNPSATRLADLIRGDISSIQNSIVLQTQEDKQGGGNPMNDLDKNYVIMQYENILQLLNVEFHNHLKKSKEVERKLEQKDNILAAQTQMMQDKDQQLFALEQVNHQLKSQLNEVVQELDFTVAQKQKLQQAYEGSEMWQQDKDILEQKVLSLQSKLHLHEQNESDLKDQLESTLAKLRASEQRSRAREEEMSQMARENQTLTRDIKNMKDIETTLKQEIHQIHNQRLKLEEEASDGKHRLVLTQAQIKQRDTEMEQLIRENRNLKGTIDAMQVSHNEILAELNAVKESITEVEREKIQMRSYIERIERDKHQNSQDTKKHQMLLDEERSRAENMEAHYKQELQKLQNQLKEQKRNYESQLQQQSLYKNENMVVGRGNAGGARGYEEKAYRSSTHNQSLNNTMSEKSIYDPPIQSPLKEQNQNFYSPQRYQRQPQQVAQYQQPPPQETTRSPMGRTDQHQKNTIAWPFLFGGNAAGTGANQPRQNAHQQQQTYNQSNVLQSDYDKFQKSAPPKRQGGFDDDNGGSLKRRHQNESQLGDLLSWGGGGDKRTTIQSQPKASMIGQQRSLERGNINSKSEKQLYNFLGQPQPQMEHQHSAGNNNERPPQKQGHIFEGPSSGGKWTNIQVLPQGAGSNHMKSQDQEFPAAGKRSTIDKSPFRGKNAEQQVNHLQNSLSALQFDKERIENDFRKLGAAKNKVQIEKKKELEIELEIVDKNIQNIKQKLREMNAL